MTILAGDIKLLASQRMTDNDDGGGRATGTVIVSGAYNTIFDDVSDVDLAYGRVNLRQVFPAIHTDDTDKYYGANVIVLDPPASDDVSITLFDQGDPFCFRNSAREFIEQYLVKGPRWPGYLYDTQLKGQRAIRFFQRTEVRIPDVGETLVLVGDEGKPTQFEQYVRVTKVSGEVKTFETSSSNGSFTRTVVTCEISDKLRYTFKGNLPTKFDNETAASLLRETVVADAASYYGTKSAAENAVLGSMQIYVQSIYNQLVPSARTESAAIDLTAGGQVSTLTPSNNGVVTLSTTAAIGPSKSIYLGSAAQPGSVSASIGIATITDSGGELVLGGVVVGSIDYQRGQLTFNAQCPNYGASTKTIKFSPAGSITRIVDTLHLAITESTRGYAYTATLTPIPDPGTLALSFLSGGKWYDLTDNGKGELTGADAAYGAGVINFTTGSIMVTLGALPDTGSEILMSWGAPTTSFNRSVGVETAMVGVFGVLGSTVEFNTIPMYLHS